MEASPTNFIIVLEFFENIDAQLFVENWKLHECKIYDDYVSREELA
jgi:hypothetical protein